MFGHIDEHLEQLVVGVEAVACIASTILAPSALSLALYVAIGAVVVIGSFTDWEEVKIPRVFKLKRKQTKG